MSHRGWFFSGVNDYEGLIWFIVIQADIPFFFFVLFIYWFNCLIRTSQKRHEDQQAPFQANREYVTLIIHCVFKKTLWAIIGLTTVTMGTSVSGVDWQVTQSEGWLTSETELQPLKSVKQPGGNHMAVVNERVHKLVHLKTHGWGIKLSVPIISTNTLLKQLENLF